MTSERPYVTLMLISSDSGKAPWSLKLSRGKYRAIVAAIVLVLLLLAAAALASPILLSHSRERAALAEENEELRRIQGKIAMLEENLQAYRQILARVTALAGVDLSEYGMLLETPPPASTSAKGSLLAVSDSNLSQSPQPIPTGFPVKGFVSRTFRPYEQNPRTRHHGVDLAVPTGTPVAATADGIVTHAGWDEVFGWIVMLRHADSVETVYGHNDTLLVRTGQTVRYGQTLALSGNTGVSSAPHVHYEIRVNGKPVDPEQYYVKRN